MANYLELLQLKPVPKSELLEIVQALNDNTACQQRYMDQNKITAKVIWESEIPYNKITGPYSIATGLLSTTSTTSVSTACWAVNLFTTVTHSLTAARNRLWVVAPSMLTGHQQEPMRQQQ